MIPLDILSDSFSIVGKKELQFQSDPEKLIRFSDTGGIFGQPFEKTLSFKQFYYKSSIVVVHPHENAIGRIKIQEDKEVVFSCPQTVLTTLLKLSKPSHCLEIW